MRVFSLPMPQTDISTHSLAACVPPMLLVACGSSNAEICGVLFCGLTLEKDKKREREFNQWFIDYGIEIMWPYSLRRNCSSHGFSQLGTGEG